MRGRRLDSETETKIYALLERGLGDTEIAAQVGVSVPTVASRRQRMEAEPDDEESARLVIGALRHLAASNAMTSVDLAKRLGVDDAQDLLMALISLGVVRTTATEDPPRYGLRKDWL